MYLKFKYDGIPTVIVPFKHLYLHQFSSPYSLPATLPITGTEIVSLINSSCPESGSSCVLPQEEFRSDSRPGHGPGHFHSHLSEAPRLQNSSGGLKCPPHKPFDIIADLLVPKKPWKGKSGGSLTTNLAAKAGIGWIQSRLLLCR